MNPPERILLIDDDRTVTGIFSRVLVKAGYEVKVVNLAAEAVAAAADFQPSLILLDANLPDGDGREILAGIRLTPEIAATRVAILSGERVSLDDMDALTWFVAKPIRLAPFLEAVQYMLACEPRRAGCEEELAA